MPPTNLLPLPYFLAVQLLARDTPNDTTGKVPNIKPGPVPPYKYPSWAFGIGILAVFVVCVFFSFTCAGINRRINRKALLRAEFPCLEANMGLVSCLAKSSSTAAAVFVMPEHAEEVKALSPMEEQKKVVDLKVVKINVQDLKMPVALPKVFKKLGRKRERGEVVADGDVELIQLSSLKGKKASLTGKGDHMFVEAYAGRDEEDSIGFVTAEERFENVDAK
ncbi:hypothetical protein VE00_01772 [Pseudogymnoascus sp. WSF 3629]|nr:hypothetical protein VE00_01772 [Pseudogymnoascus sp. WSF 3629]